VPKLNNAPGKQCTRQICLKEPSSMASILGRVWL
jgi:hypothetical protein